jgi:MFS family permease
VVTGSRSSLAGYLRGLRPNLPRSVYVLQAGLVINAFGNGAANPFLVIYLHNVRGFPLAVAGLVGTTSAACALVAAMLAGYLADRYDARTIMIGGLVVSSIGWSLYPLVLEPWPALGLAVLTGTGIGTWLTMQSTMLALVTPAPLRHAAFAQQRVAANLGLGLGGLTGGLLANTDRPGSFTAIFILNAATFLVYTLFLARMRLPPPAPAARTGTGYRSVLRDRAFRRVAGLNLGYVAVSVALVGSMFPVFARNHAGATERFIGVLFLINSVLIVVLQMPIARAVEGRRRTRSLALTCVLLAVTWTLVALAGLVTVPVAAVLLVLAFAILSIGECLYDATYGPLVSDLAPEGHTGRYMATSGLSWQLAFIAVPGLGGLVLDAAPHLLWPVVAAVALALAIATLRLEPHLPPAARRTAQGRITDDR